MGQKILITVFLFLLVGQVVGCTRNLGDMANLSLALKGSNSGQAVGNNVEHIVINVRGPDLPREIIWSWDGDPNAMVPPPQVITIPVPKGNDRLIQVLLVNRDPINGGMTFHYGDVLKPIQNIVEDVFITTSLVGAGSGETADIGGRYFNLDGTSPTGILEALFMPPNGNPSMKIMETSIVNGWFKIFLVDGAPLSYQLLHDKSILFANAKHTDTEFSPTTTTTKLVHLAIPKSYEPEMNGAPRLQEQRRAILGFFGPGGNTYGKPVCYTPGSPSVTVPHLYQDSGLSQLMHYDPAITFNLTPGPTSTTTITRLAGTGLDGGTDTMCRTGSLFADRLILDGVKAGEGPGSMFGFENIFILPPKSDTVVGHYLSGNLTLYWNYLPNVIGPQGVDGVSVFASPYFNGNLGGDEVDCERLPAMGFYWVGDVTSGLTNSITFPVDPWQFPSTKAVVCPFKYNYAGRAKYLFPGVEYQNWNGPIWGPSLKITGVPSTPAPKSVDTTVSTCTPFEIHHLVNGVETNVSAAQTVNLSVNSTASSWTLYAGANCTGTVIASQASPSGTTTIPAANSFTTVYLATPSGSEGYYTLGFGLPNSNVFYYEVTAYDGTSVADRLTLQVAPNMAVGHCYPLKILFEKAATNKPAANGADRTMTLSTNNWGSFYQDKTCSGPTISSVFAPQGLLAIDGVYFKPVNSGAQTVTAIGGTGITDGSISITVEVDAIQKLYINPHGTVALNTCVPFDISTANNLGVEVIAPAPVDVNISISAGGGIYHNNTCSGTAQTSITTTVYAGHTHSQKYFFFATTTGGLNANSTNPTASGSLSY